MLSPKSLLDWTDKVSIRLKAVVVTKWSSNEFTSMFVSATKPHTYNWYKVITFKILRAKITDFWIV